MEVSNPDSFNDDPEALLKPRPWLQKFIIWLKLVKNGCPAAGGAGGVFCFWIGRNCSYNDCPRRNFEEDEFITESVLKLETLQQNVKRLKLDNQEKAQQISKLKKELKP